MKPLLLQALKKAGQIRTRLKLDMFEPVNIFDICSELGATVQFVDIDMEGMYINIEEVETKLILLSKLRPFPRRVYTCAHELGHHLFRHGTKVDGLAAGPINNSEYNSEEELVDAFAGAFLMPIAGVEIEFSKRNWDIRNADFLQFFIISSVFGVGYATLVTHCKINRLITVNHSLSLLKYAPGKILQSIIGNNVPKAYFKIIDNKANLNNIDMEVSNYLFLPSSMKIEGSHLLKIKDSKCGTVYNAHHVGITRAIDQDSDKSFFIRIQNSGYIGFAEFRHLEEKETKINRL